MELPQIDFNRPVPDTSRSPLIVDDARRRALGVVEEGLAVFGQEYVKGQTNKAAASLAQGLNDIEADLDKQTIVNTQFVREKLGSLDSLDPAIRAQVVQQGMDITTGEITEMDRDDIPVWAVAGAIYDAQAKKALGAAAQNITVGGWAADFQEKAQGEIITRKAKINARSMKAGLEYLVEQDTNSALNLANAGKFPEALDVISKSRSMDPAYKEKLQGHVEKIEQVRPVYEALQREDYGAMATYLGKLNDPAEFTKLAPNERAAFSERLKSEIKQFQAAAKSSQKDALKAAADKGWNGLFEIVRAGGTPTFKSIPPPGTIDPDEQKQMIEWVENRRKGHETKTDLNLYATLSEMAREKPEEFANLSITSLINRLSPGDFKHFVDLQNKAPGATNFDDFLNTEEAINVKLPASLDPKAFKDDPAKMAQVGQVKQIIQHELAALGHRASLTERDDIIDRVIKDTVKVEPGWFSDSVKVDTSVPPKYVVALRRVAADLGFGLDSEGIASTYKDFAYYEDGINTAWAPQAGGKRLTPNEALGVYGYLKSRWSEIDAELNRKSMPLTNDNRTALAVQGYLSER